MESKEWTAKADEELAKLASSQRGGNGLSLLRQRVPVGAPGLGFPKRGLGLGTWVGDPVTGEDDMWLAIIVAAAVLKWHGERAFPQLKLSLCLTRTLMIEWWHQGFWAGS